MSKGWLAVTRPGLCGSSFSDIPNAILEFLLKLVQDAEDKLDEDDEDAEKKEDIAESVLTSANRQLVLEVGGSQADITVMFVGQ